MRGAALIALLLSVGSAGCWLHRTCDVSEPHDFVLESGTYEFTDSWVSTESEQLSPLAEIMDGELVYDAEEATVTLSYTDASGATVVREFSASEIVVDSSL